MRWYLFLLALLVLSSCEDEPKPTREELISKNVESRRQKYLDNKIDDCLERLQDSAEDVALNRIKGDFAFLNDTTFGVPHFPQKPEFNKIYEEGPDIRNEPLFDSITVLKESDSVAPQF